MATRVGTLNNPQEMAVVVNGPEDANRLIICTGDVPMSVIAISNTSQVATYTFLVGPVLTRRQFVRAVVSAGITKNAFTAQAATAAPLTANWLILSADADWDDESGQVEGRVEVRVDAGFSTNASITGISYNISILAALPAA